MKRSPRPDIAAAEAARVGEDLREARLTLGATVEDMADHLRINRRYIHALEEGRVRDLPGSAYAVGFVRSYAAALGLDPDEAVRRFRDVTGGSAAKSGELVFPEPVPSRGVPAGALVAVGVVIAIGAYVAWYNWTGSGNRVVDSVPPLPPRLEQTAQEGARLQGTPPQVSPSPLTVAPTPAPAPAAPAQAAAPPRDPNEPRIVLRARGESWIQVRDTRENRVLLDRVLRGGETWSVPNREGIVLTTGKAENLEFVVDGELATTTLTGVVGVRRGIPLEVDRLRVAAEPAAPATQPATAPRP
ncbi:DUF4115 domain-containing protein [Roseomonas terrae]|uniref:DUF4115 domain-containing protein n=1 Tax=Neoroseomonas terrae TaxID=424799 RepID=A0ABS5EPM0_9PROT|nr:RodZ domain-containing protein [Neoroseomonas terrae]MBR0652990.1 DUF4115 domain-containing protein [Neoroseomonas terrae]